MKDRTKGKGNRNLTKKRLKTSQKPRKHIKTSRLVKIRNETAEELEEKGKVSQEAYRLNPHK